MFRGRRPLSCLLWALLAPLLGCDALQQFRTAPGEVFNGEVIGSDTKIAESSFIRQGFDSHTQLDLTFDPVLASKYPGDAPASAAAPGTIETYLCQTKADFCPQRSRTPGQFQRSKLEPIASLSNDVLSQYDFPGGGRLRNYMFGARFASPDASGGTIARSAMVFLSLMEDGKVEVRIISPSVLADDGTTELAPALFGVFVLDRHKK
jgi:hypothetical protein